MKPRKPLRTRNVMRHAKNLLRAYGPPERRAWVKQQPCVVGPLLDDPCDGPPENAHTEVLGLGLKADYTTVIPTCRRHNGTARRLAPEVRAALAADTQRRWLAHSC